MNKIFRLLYTLSLVSISYIISAQTHPSCDGTRYAQIVFDEVESYKGIKFGEGVTIAGEMQELFMDVYAPADDSATKRPTIVLAFGGSYIGGNREQIEWLCEEYARRGFVAVSIDYRLYDLPLFPLPTELEITEVVIKSISDMKAAIRHLREDADTDNLYKIDPELIFVGGISAGSITASHTAFLDETDVVSEDIADLLEANGGIEGNSSDNFQYSSEVQGLVNYSGGLANNIWIDINDPTFISFHDDDDGIVPYEDDFAKIFGVSIIFMYGSKSCSDQANDVGLYNELYPVNNSDGHVSYFFDGSDATTNEALARSGSFLYEIICGSVFSNVSEEAIDGLQIYPNPSNGLFHITHEENSALDLKVFDSFGRLILRTKNANRINLSHAPSSVYFIECTNSTNGQRSVRRIIKK